MPQPDSAEGRPLVGDVIAGKYRIDSVAGEGGMGIIYEAEHVILRQRVAVKAMLPGAMTSAEAVERFSFEAAAVARIASEHVVRVMDAGSLPNGAPYLVMEYLEGCDLDELLASRGRLPPGTVVDYALQALEALAHAHAAQVVHRDLKPANLFLARTPDGRHVIKLVDFGISTSFDASGDNDDRVFGSLAYMSPEQLENGPIDPRSDLWSLGVVMYEMLCGSPPFAGTWSQLIAQIRNEDALPLSERIPSIPSDLSWAIAKCLRRDPAQRWRTSAELARGIAPFGTGAWLGALERIDRALARTAPRRTPRRFESLDNALQALDAEWNHDPGAETLAPTDLASELLFSERASSSERHSASSRAVAKAPAPSAFGDTMPAPPSDDREVVVIPAFSRTLPSRTRSKPALRLLLIDDSELALELHAEVLTTAGFDVRTTKSAGELDALLDSWKPHLVLMDVNMPGTSGDSLCARVKARFRATVPVVFLSALPRAVLEERARKGGADAFLTKSSDWPALVEFVRNICAMTYSPEDLP